MLSNSEIIVKESVIQNLFLHATYRVWHMIACRRLSIYQTKLIPPPMIVDCLSMLVVYLFVACLSRCCSLPPFCYLHVMFVPCMRLPVLLLLVPFVVVLYLHFVTCLSCLFRAWGCLCYLLLVPRVVVTVPPFCYLPVMFAPCMRLPVVFASCPSRCCYCIPPFCYLPVMFAPCMRLPVVFASCPSRCCYCIPPFCYLHVMFAPCMRLPVIFVAWGMSIFLVLFFFLILATSAGCQCSTYPDGSRFMCNSQKAGCQCGIQ